MSILRKPKPYVAEIIMRKKRTILVEGASDKKILEALVNRLCNFHSKNYCDIKIDSINSIEKEDFEIPKVAGAIGNRARVESICSSVLSNGVVQRKGIKFAGFVDREFDGFDLDQLQDLQSDHYLKGCVVYSRGHSIENYLFDFLLFKELLWSVFNTKSVRETLEITEVEQILEEFENIFYDAINIACAIGLAAYQLGMLTFIKENLTLEDNIASDILRTERGKVFIDFEQWKHRLIEKGIDTSKIECLAKRYSSYREKLVAIDLSVVRRLCHGHLGFNLILFACCYCFKRIKRLEQKSIRSLICRVGALSSEGGSAFEQCAIEWSRKVQEQGYEYPKELFSLLGVLNEGFGYSLEESV